MSLNKYLDDWSVEHLLSERTLTDRDKLIIGMLWRIAKALEKK